MVHAILMAFRAAEEEQRTEIARVLEQAWRMNGSQGGTQVRRILSE